MLKIINSTEIIVMDGHQDTPVLQRSNYRARGQVQSWWGEWKIFKKLAWQNFLKLTYTIEINVMGGHQDTPVLHRSNYRSNGWVQSWWGEWKISMKLVSRGIHNKKSKIMQNGDAKSCKSCTLLSPLWPAQKIMKNFVWYVGVYITK